MKHQTIASKDRTNLFIGKPDFTITPATGQIILDWCNDGVNLEMIRSKIKSSKTIEELTAIYHAYPEWYQQLTSDFCRRKKYLWTNRINQLLTIPLITLDMEIMQLQPVRANLIYPNRNKANNPYIQTVEPIEIINTGIISTNPVEADSISTREGNKFLLLRLIQRKQPCSTSKRNVLHLCSLRTMRLLYHTPVSLKLYGKR